MESTSGDGGRRAASERPSPARASLAPVAPAAAAAAAAAVTAAWTLLALLARRRVLRPLDQLLGRDHCAVLVLGEELEADPAALLVDFLHDDVEHVTAGHHVLDVTDAARPDVRDVEQAVRPLLQLDERAELRRLHNLRVAVLVADLRALRQALDRGNGRLGLRSLGRVDEDRAVLLDVDLHLVLGLHAADRLAALADHEPDLLGVDLHRGDPRRVRGELAPDLRNRREHLVEDGLARPLRLLERVLHDLARDAGDLDVHLERGDPVPRAGDLEVHVAEVILGTLDVRENDVVVTLLHEAHR